MGNLWGIDWPTRADIFTEEHPRIKAQLNTHMRRIRRQSQNTPRTFIRVLQKRLRLQMVCFESVAYTVCFEFVAYNM